VRPLPLGKKLTLWSAFIVGVVLILFSAATTIFLYYEEVEALDARMRPSVCVPRRDRDSGGKGESAPPR